MAQATETKTAAAVLANPAPLGLFGFAATTLVSQMGNTGLVSSSSLDIGGALTLALAYGGLGQLIAGLWEFRNGNTFGGVAFSSYGLFWLSFWAFFNIGGSAPKGSLDVAWYLVTWTIITGILLLGTFRLNLGLVVVFALLFLTFLFLCIGAFNAQGAGTGMTAVGGWLGVITAIAAFYVGASGVLASVGADILPVFPFKK